MAKPGKNIEEELEELNNQNKKIPKRKLSYWLSSVAFVAFTIIMIIVLSWAKKASIKKIKSDYLNSVEYESLMSLYDNRILRGDVDAFNWFQENIVGLDTNIALAGISHNCEANTNYYNDVAGIKAYIDENNKLEIFLEEEKIFLSTDDVGEILATPYFVYYIDNSDGERLHQFDISNRSDVILVDKEVYQFAIYGNTIFYLGNDEQLSQVKLDTMETRDIANNVQRFFVTDGLAVQNGTQVILISIDGIQKKELANSALLVGADSNHIYFTNFGVTPEELQSSNNIMVDLNSENSEESISGNYIVYAKTISSGAVKAIDGRKQFVRAVYVLSEGILVDTMGE